MEKKIKPQLYLPFLRFKGFEGEWEKKKFSNCCIKMKSGGTPKADNKNYYNGDISFASITDFKDKYLSQTVKYINDEAIKNSSAYILEKGNLLLSIYATIGKPIINTIDVALPQSILGIKLSKENNLEFFYQYMIFLNKNFINLSEQGTQANLSLKTVSNIYLNLPSLPEQQKIAEFFSLLDKQISLWERKLELYLLFYRFYLNKLFVNNQNKVPKLRFHSFKNEWRSSKLNSLINDNSLDFQFNNSNFLDATSIISKVYRKHINEPFKLAPKNSIVFIKDGSNAGNFFMNYEGSKIASTCEWFSTCEHTLYIYHFLISKIKFITNNLITGETIPHLYKKTLLNLNVFIPSLPEPSKKYEVQH